MKVTKMLEATGSIGVTISVEHISSCPKSVVLTPYFWAKDVISPKIVRKHHTFQKIIKRSLCSLFLMQPKVAKIIILCRALGRYDTVILECLLVCFLISVGGCSCLYISICFCTFSRNFTSSYTPYSPYL